MDKGIDAMIERYLPDAAIESPNLSYIEKKILAVLLFKWDNYSKAQDSGVIITSNDSLCREARISKRDLVFFRQVLIAKGLIKVPQVGKQRGDGSHYIVNYDALEEPIPAMKKIDKERFKKKPSKPLETPMGTVYINTKINTDTNTNIKAKAKADIEPTITTNKIIKIESLTKAKAKAEAKADVEPESELDSKIIDDLPF